MIVRDAPGSALKLYFLSFHGCLYRQPFLIWSHEVLTVEGIELLVQNV